MEQTLIILKPHPEEYTGKTQDFFIQYIKERIITLQCQTLDIYRKKLSKTEAELHYQHLSLLGFFPKMIDYIMSDTCVFMLIEGENSIKKIHTLKKEIRKEYGCHPGIFDWIYNDKPYKNILHASDSKNEANREVTRYFSHFIKN